jgi:hypothetical protein
MTAALDAVPLTALERAEFFHQLHVGAPEPRAVSRAIATRTFVTLRSVAHDLQIASCLTKDVRDALRSTPFANRKVELLALARLRPAMQRRVVEKLRTCAARSVRAALEAL